MLDTPSVKYRILNHTAIAGIILFALFGWTGLSLSSLGAALLILTVVGSAPSFFHVLSRDATGWLVAAAMVYLVVQYFLTSWLQPLASEPDPGALQDWFILWLFPVVAWALKEKSAGFVRFLFGLAAVGLLSPVAWYIQWAELADFFGKRQEYQISSVPMGLYAGLVVFGLVVFLDALVNTARTKGRWVRVGAIGLWGLMLALALIVFVTTQSRGGWLAFSIASIFAVVLLLVMRGADILAMLRKHRIPLALALGLVLVFLWFAHGVLEDRIVRESEVYQTLPTLDRESIPYTSVGRRMHMWIYGVEKWVEQPMFGWGMGAARELLEEDPELSRHPHFHNAYLQIGVELGLLGLMFYGGVVVLLLARLVRSFQVHGTPLDLLIFVFGAWVMILSWGLIDTRFAQSDGRFLFLMLFGVTMALGQGWVHVAKSVNGDA
ncbi:MAG: O-antigen ligase family protein [Marinobacter sp.]|nr:O-antigen ligase family protein [Marinobacter sp.]MDX5336328.1 O-antigen ligase family protein [Marinobacter sp.]